MRRLPESKTLAEFPSPLIPWPGGSKFPATLYIVVLNTLGRLRQSPYMNGPLTVRVSFYWGTTNSIWNIPGGTSTKVRFFGDTGELLLNGFATKVEFWVATPPYPWFMWRLIPAMLEGRFTPSGPSSETLGSGSPPSYAGDTTGRSSRTQHTESECDDFGTVVTEVTIITTRKRYRVEDA